MTNSTPESRIASQIGMIGAGRLGSTLALALVRAGLPLVAVTSARAVAAEALALRIPGCRVEPSPAQIAATCDVVVLAVPDAEVARIAGANAWRPGQRVVHCSGALDLSVLQQVLTAGGLRGCLHPLQAFPERFGAPERLASIVCGVEGDGPLHAELEDWVERLGARSMSLRGVHRARYHAAAVFASNFVVSLHAAAARCFALCGLPQELARSALAPLTTGASEAVSRLPLPAALTGPLARGDVATIAAHLQALQAAPDLQALYARLSSLLLALPLSFGAEERRALEALLHEASPSED